MKITNKLVIVCVLFPCLFLQGKSQTLSSGYDQDCKTAIPVCASMIVQPEPYSGSGFTPNEVNSSITCLGNGEQNSVWYSFITATAGELNFSIIPDVPTNDYDWIVFNITQASCEEIYNDSSLVVSCNFAPTPGTTGPNGSNDPQCRPIIPVNAGEYYVICITNFSINDAGGFVLDFSQSTADYVCTLDITETKDTDVTIYPNPTDDICTIQLGKTYDDIDIRIYSMNGLLLQETPAYNTDHISIEHDLAAGVYLVQIHAGNQIVSKRLIVK